MKLTLKRKKSSKDSGDKENCPYDDIVEKHGVSWVIPEARDSFSFYCQLTYRRRYHLAKHISAICEILERVEKGELKRVMFFLPPRHSKSMTVTESFPSWFIGRDPERRVIEVSYSDDFARKFGRENLKKIIEFGHDIFGIRVDPKSSSAAKWGISGHRGGMISAGIGGSITGEGADLLIVDDPIKNAEEANSETYRANLWNEWNSTLQTRLQAGGAVIIIQTRWHEADLAGQILDSEDGKNWFVYSLPAEAEEGDLLGREIGEPLWAEGGYDEVWIKEKKVQVGSYVWAALYQQRPAPIQGETLKRSWWRFYRLAPGINDYDEVIQSWDCAFKDLKTSSRVCGQVWGRIRADYYLIDEVCDHMDFPTTVKAVITLSGKYPRAIAKLVEAKANGTAVVSVLKHRVSGLIEVEPEGGKVARAQAVSPLAEAGNVWLPDPAIAPWIHDFIQECSTFPHGRYNDRVDSMTQALTRWAMQRRNPANEPTLEEATPKSAGKAIEQDFGLGFGNDTGVPDFGV